MVEVFNVLIGGNVSDMLRNHSNAMGIATPYYTTVVHASIFTVPHHDGKVLVCEAKNPGPNGKLVKASATLELFKVGQEPVVNCYNADAYVGKKFSFMKCHVDATFVKGDVTMRVKINSRNVTIQAGQDAYIDGQRILITKKDCFQDRPNYRFALKSQPTSSRSSPGYRRCRNGIWTLHTRLK